VCRTLVGSSSLGTIVVGLVQFPMSVVFGLSDVKVEFNFNLQSDHL
jgi:hypothetical protein